VAVVDDDAAFANSLCELLEVSGCRPRRFGSAVDFMSDPEIETVDVVLLDIFMPGVDGLSTQRLLAARDLDLPIVVVTGSSEVDVAVRAMKQGAIDYLVKPFEPDALLEKVRSAAETGRRRRRARELRHELVRRLEELTPREREVLERLIGGQSSKVIARELDMSPRTVDTHRTRILRKFEAETTLMLINRFADSNLDLSILRD
jgi:RNA polymerase sigma factor (sigma-70 family)